LSEQRTTTADRSFKAVSRRPIAVECRLASVAQSASAVLELPFQHSLAGPVGTPGMMVTGTRSVMRVLGTTGAEIPKAFISSVNCKRNRRCKKKSNKSEVSNLPERLPSAFPRSSGLPADGADNFGLWNLDLPLEREKLGSPLFRGTYTPKALSFHSAFRDRLCDLLRQEEIIHVDSTHLLMVNSELDDKLDSTLRKETLSRLWWLHSAFYNLSSLSFCRTTCLLDLFISKVKVKPKYAMCVAAACYYIASKFERMTEVLLPTPDSLVMLSRCGGTANDLTRMVEIILTKLSPATVASVGACSATALNFMECFAQFSVGEASSTHDPLGNQRTSDSLSYLPDTTGLSSFLRRKLELALTSTEAASFRPACLALALLSIYCLPSSDSDGCISTVEVDEIMRFTVPDLLNLAQLCGVHWSSVEACKAAVQEVLIVQKDPSSFKDCPPCSLLGSSPPLVWTLSRRTQRSISTSSPPALSTVFECEEEVVQLQAELTGLSF
ncbi:cyclin domain protein, partial [Opisthorchis viverrini]